MAFTSGHIVIATAGNELTGYAMSGDVTIGATGITAIGSDKVTTSKILNANVTYAKIQNVSATDLILGRSTAGAGVIEEIACTAFARSILDDATAAAARTTLGIGSGDSPSFTGATISGTLTLGADVELARGAANRLDLGTGDSLNLVSGGIQVGATQVLSSARALANISSITLDDSANVILNTTTGTKIGTATNQKLAFWNAAPVIQPSAYTQTYATATKTHADPTGAALTDNSGGSASQTLAAITGGGAGCENATKDAIASLADEVNKLIADVANVKQVLNQVIDDLQIVGLVG